MENSNPKISVIVPVYKAEAYLHRCVDSLLAQTFMIFEILLVDDGSPDRSGEICDEYAKKDSRVRVFHKENGGGSSARQCGMDNARGEYTIHADPDDWVEPNYLEELYKKAKDEDADMVICDFYKVYRNNVIYKNQKPNKLNADAVLRQLLGQQLHGACWNKLIRRNIYLQYDIRFPMDITVWEDLFVNCCVLHYQIKVSYLNRAFYYYDCYSNENSLVRSFIGSIVISQMNFVAHLTHVLDISLYESEFREVKYIVKKNVFAVDFFTKQDFFDLYKDIDARYILTHRKTVVSVFMLLSLLVNYEFFHTTYRLFSILRYRWKDCIKRI